MKIFYQLLLGLATCMVISCDDTNMNFPSNSIEVVAPPLETPLRFQVDINTTHPQFDEPAMIEKDWGVLILPKSYDPNGLPTPLVIGCHGGGGTVDSKTSQLETMDLYRYLVSKGYAVMDMAGMPETFSSRLKIDHNRTVGSFVALRAYEEGYKIIKKKFNIDTTGVYVNGGSNGGLISANIVLHSKIPVKCQSGMSPAVSIQEQAWNISTGAISGGLFSSLQNRANIIQIYRMKSVATQQQLNIAAFERDKVTPYDALAYIRTLDRNINYPCPLKIWHPVNDPLVDIKHSRLFINAVKSRGGFAELVAMPGGGHSPEFFGPTIDIFSFDGRSYELKNSVKELFEFYESFR